MPETRATQRFAILAVEFCKYLEDGELGSSRLRDLLATLDAAAAELPCVEPSASKYADPVGLNEACRRVGLRIALVFGKRSFYEMQAGGEPTIGDLCDDFFDI